MDITINLMAVVLLLVANGFFVAAELALVKVRGFRIAALADEGSATARLTQKWRGDQGPGEPARGDRRNEPANTRRMRSKVQ